jgi:hypothetical protein
MEDYYFVTDACSTTLLLPNQTHGPSRLYAIAPTMSAIGG